MTTPLIITQTYPNGATRTLTITGITPQENNSAIIITAEDGAIAVSEADHPDLWPQIAAES
jgi:hypothetical protein